MTPVRWSFVVALAGGLLLAARAAPLTVTVATPPPASTGYFKLGTASNPAGHEISVNSRSLLYDGRPVLPVMGEFHYSRCPAGEWHDELLKLKAGGVEIVATYVFWIHHEEIEGQWDWSGQRDLRRFVQTCGELGLKVVVRCGPWCHGEVRNGGLPDWAETKNWRLRSTDPNFLAAVKVLYGQIGQQLAGQLWKDGGPVIGIQVDNEYGGEPEYLLALKQLAIDAGLDVPLYLKTGLPEMRRPVPPGELLPLFGAYADGFWSRSLQPMDGADWQNFLFKITRTDTGIGSDALGNRPAGDAAGTEKYPYLTCEVGGGMTPSYHRRINLDERDVEAVALAQLGSGSSLMGYYMYQGGQNPEGKLSTLQESLTTGYGGYNDLPVKNYDFGAPLGEYGQVHPQYHWLRRLHLFLQDFGGTLAAMPATLPDRQPTNQSDLDTLRWAVRSDGAGGYVFVNNYQRRQPMPPKKDVQFKLNLPGGPLVFPGRPVTIPADEFFIWPFNLDLDGDKLIYATAQPVCCCQTDDQQTYFFAETPGVPAEFVFAAAGNSVQARSGKVKKQDGQIQVHDVKPGRDVAIRLNETVSIVLLNNTDSLALGRGTWRGEESLFLTRANALTDEDGTLRLFSNDPSDLTVDVFETSRTITPIGGLTALGGNGRAKDLFDGIFWRFKPSRPPQALFTTAWPEFVRPAGLARTVPRSQGPSAVALAPAESDFTNAAVWKIHLPADLEARMNPLLRIQYTGDVARLRLNGRLIDDQFYNGRSFDLGLKRYWPEIMTGDLRLEILPLPKDAPIYLPDEAKPKIWPAIGVATLQSLEIVRQYEADFRPAGQ
jgi:hypothetical protein